MVVFASKVVAIADIAHDPTATDEVGWIVGVREREALQDPELRFDQVEPRRIGGCEHRMDPQPAQGREEARVIVDVAGCRG